MSNGINSEIKRLEASLKIRVRNLGYTEQEEYNLFQNIYSKVLEKMFQSKHDSTINVLSAKKSLLQEAIEQHSFIS